MVGEVIRFELLWSRDPSLANSRHLQWKFLWSLVTYHYPGNDERLDMICQKAGAAAFRTGSSSGHLQEVSLVTSSHSTDAVLVLLNRNSYYQKGTHQKGTLILLNRNSSKRNTHINISGLEETLLKGNLYHRNPHASNMNFYNGS